MKLERFELQMVALVLLLFAAGYGLLSLASAIGKMYGPTAGILTVLLPLAAATGYLLYLLIRETTKRGED